MIIKDLVNLAKYSELSGVSVKNDINAIVAFINLGMLELYKRFPIKVDEYIVNLVNNNMYYTMPTNFMYPLSAFGERPKANPLQNNELPINNEDDKKSVFFTDWNTMQVPSSITGSFVSIIYVTTPVTVTVVQAEDGTTSLDLPETLIDALLSYIGFKAYLGVKSDGQSENNAHWARFERSCSKAIALGVAFPTDSMSMATRIADRGFV